jgi:hypothetical protein
MKTSRLCVLTLLLGTLTLCAAAQQSPDPQPLPAPPPQTAPAPAAPNVEREFVPDGISALGRGASSRTEFNLDHQMLVLASKLDKDNEDLRRVIAGVSGVSVHSYRFPDEVEIDQDVWDSLVQQYREAGWQHLVSKRPKERDGGVATDLWLKLEGGTIRNVAVLFTGTRQVNFVSVAGSVAPVDLLRLSGHFGIPKMDGGVAVPVPLR